MSVPASVTLYKLNDNTIEIDGLSNSIDDSFFNSANVTATLKDSTGAIVTGVNAISLSYVSASNGLYRGEIQQGFDPAVGSGYTLHLDAAQGCVVGHLEIKAKVKIRKT